MVEYKDNKDKNDILAMPILGYIFKNQKFIMFIRIVVLALFIFGVYLGFEEPTKENTFTRYLFWGLFWSLFMVVTLTTFGRIFCGICPHGFLGKYITKYGLQKEMPSWLKNPWWGLILIVVGWWAIYYTFPGFYRIPLITAILFVVMTALAFLLYYLYKDMSYCKYVCPIGSLTKAYHRISFTWLGSYKDDCSDCKTFACAKACPYNLKPFTFDTKNSMEDCSLCMDCSDACDAISFKVVPPGQSLYKKFKLDKIEVWTYILITAAITISMSFHHGLGRSKISEFMPWTQTAEYFKGFVDFGGADPVGLFAFLYATALSLLFAFVGMFVASKALKADYYKTFYTLGYAFAPLFIIGGLDHLLHSFFTHTYADIVNGFIYGFGLDAEKVQNLASRKDAWLAIFGIFKYIAVAWALFIMYKRVNLFDASKTAKTVAYVFASLLIAFYLFLILFRGYAIATYGKADRGSHSNHGGSSKVFQSVSKDKVTFVQTGKNKRSCPTCGMSLAKFYKANHAAKDNEVTKQFCSLHCVAKEMSVKKTSLKDFQVVDVKSLKFIDAQKAYYVLGAKKKGIMTKSSKFAFASYDDASAFMKKYGGEIVSFDEAYQNALKDFK